MFAVALTALSTSNVAAKVNCPVAPPPGSTIGGGMIVTGQCILDHVTVTGGITVTSTGQLELENSIVSGGIVVQPGGELDSGHTFFSNTPTGTPSSISGGIKFTNGLDIDLYNATVTGGVVVDGVTEGFPTICGSSISGGLTYKNITTGGYIGDPNEGFPAQCAGNRIDTSVYVINSPGLIEIEHNNISGSVVLDNARIELAGNTIGGSLTCKNGTTFFETEHDGLPEPPNTVNGSNSCS
jgi:hypothetical protein